MRAAARRAARPRAAARLGDDAGQVDYDAREEAGGGGRGGGGGGGGSDDDDYAGHAGGRGENNRLYGDGSDDDGEASRFRGAGWGARGAAAGGSGARRGARGAPAPTQAPVVRIGARERPSVAGKRAREGVADSDEEVAAPVAAAVAGTSAAYSGFVRASSFKLVDAIAPYVPAGKQKAPVIGLRKV
jgi:hypothetical protein